MLRIAAQDEVAEEQPLLTTLGVTKGLGGRRNSLIGLDSAREIQGCLFGFGCGGFGICCAWLGFPFEGLDFVAGGFGLPSPDFWQAGGQTLTNGSRDWPDLVWILTTL
jgi:hypothetical protein